MDYEQARFNMIEQQIRPWEVLDQTVLDLLGQIHREDFVPAQYKKLALADVNIPLPHDQLTMTPKVEARLLQALNLNPTDTVLEIGTGCAYLTALLAKRATHVVSIDIFPDFTQAASVKLDAHHIKNVELYTGDALNGWPANGPYDAIAVTGSLPGYSGPIEQQLRIGGRLFLITGTSPVMTAMLITRTGQQEWSREPLFETDLPPLIGAKLPEQFRF